MATTKARPNVEGEGAKVTMIEKKEGDIWKISYLRIRMIYGLKGMGHRYLLGAKQSRQR